MTRSMTGFARHATSFSGGTLTWELRAVNHRYLEPSFRLPEVVRNIEGDLRDALKAQLVRGKIECHLKFDADTDGRTIHLNADAMRDVHRVIQEMSSLLETELTPDPHELLRMPGITDTESVDAAAAAAAAMAGFQLAIASLSRMREREGAELEQALRARLGDIKQVIDDVRANMPAINRRLLERLQSRLADLDVDVDPGRLEQEVAIQVQKADIDEELDRLDAHLQETAACFGKVGGIGRRLDFLMQEFNREANTLGSKAAAISMILSAVDLTVLIEQMHEQVQNIE